MAIDKTEVVKAVESLTIGDETVTEAQAAIDQLQSLGIQVPKRLLDRIAQASRVGSLPGLLGKLAAKLGHHLHVPATGATQVILWVWHGESGYEHKVLVRDFGNRERLSDKLVRTAIAQGRDAALRCLDVNPKRVD